MPHKKYLVVFDVNSGQWVNSVSELERIFVFEAKNDEEALTIVASYAKGKKKCDVTLLMCITKGMMSLEINIKDKIGQLTDIEELTDARQREARFERFSPGARMFSQLQPAEM